MNTNWRLWIGSFLAGVAGLAGVARADVVYVDATGNGNFLEIQPAINAAIDGNVILVRSGTYAGFVVDQRRIFIVEDVGATAKVAGTVTVSNTNPTGLVLVQGLEITAASGGTPGAAALVVSACAGSVRIQDCILRGGDGGGSNPTGGAGGKGADIQDSARVCFASTDLRGGNGYGFVVFGPNGGAGGKGLESRGSSLALYDCTLRGGAGGDADYAVPTFAGRGGDGAKILDFGVLASGCAFNGGVGGGTSFTPGAGGDGLVVAVGAQAQLVDDTYAGGMGGYGYNGNFGATGQPQSGGGIFNSLGGVRRKFHAKALAAESSTLTIEVTGQAGDSVWLLASSKPVHVYSPGLAGFTLVQVPALMTSRPLGVLPVSGSASFVVPTAPVNGVLDAQRSFLQGLIRSSSGTLQLGSPMHVVVLNCSALSPDCNANAECDTCDILRATSLDCDANGVPDDCQPDCNANGTIDPCDIAAGTSVDQNNNGIPDDCEPQTTWYVDDSASPGGNGSPGAPFQTLGQPFGLAVSGDTILVADGTYIGPQNRNLLFGGRELVVQSLGGYVNCIIDCQTQGRAFRIDAGSDSSSRIEGFTIKNGKTTNQDSAGGAIRMEQSSTAIKDCWFENNVSLTSGGGAIYSNNGGPDIRGSVFAANHCNSAHGGAVQLNHYSGMGFVDCTFVSNTANSGGAVVVFNSSLPASPVHFERCSFRGNSAFGNGGALNLSSSNAQLSQCLFAGNSADYRGGAVWNFQANLRIINCTVVDNRSTNQGGAMFTDYFGFGAPVSHILRNSIFWGNTSSNGKQFESKFGHLDIDSCSVENGAAAVSLAGLATLSYGPQNQMVLPQFVDPDGPDNNVATVDDNDYRLSLASTCIDAGENAEVELDWFDLDGDGIFNEFVPFDLDGAPRMVDVPSAPDTGLGSAPLVDLGAWERQP